MHKILTAFAAVELLFCAPVHAGVYGPPAPVEAVPHMPSHFEVGPDESVNAAASRYERDTRNAKRWRLGFEFANVADAASTCYGLARGLKEMNPMYGHNPNCGRVVAIKAAFGLAEWLLMGHMIRKDPKQASTFIKIATLLQGGVVGWNIGQIAK